MLVSMLVRYALSSPYLKSMHSKSYWGDLKNVIGGVYYIASAEHNWGVFIMLVDSLTIKLSPESYGTTCI